MSSTINATTTSGVAITGDTSGSLALQTNNGNTAVTIDTSQNVGIGTASPSAKAQIGDTTVVATNRLVFGKAQTASEGNLPAIGQQSAGAGNDLALAGTSTSAAIRFYTGASTNSGEIGTGSNAERMRIDSSGKLLIGMTSYSAFANGVATYSDANGAVLNLGHTTGSGNGAGFVLFGYNNGGIGSITQNGTTAVAYNTTSDYRLKTDVTPIQDALATVEALNPVSFTWIDGRPDDGFLAHEIQAVIPNCVTGKKDAVNEDGAPKYQQMDSSGVIPFLVKAIQELNAKVDAQALEIKALKGAK